MLKRYTFIGYMGDMLDVFVAVVSSQSKTWLGREQEGHHEGCSLQLSTCNGPVQCLGCLGLCAFGVAETGSLTPEGESVMVSVEVLIFLKRCAV